MFRAKQRGVDINQTKRLFVALVCPSLIYASTMKLCAGISRILEILSQPAVWVDSPYIDTSAYS